MYNDYSDLEENEEQESFFQKNKIIIIIIAIVMFIIIFLMIVNDGNNIEKSKVKEPVLTLKYNGQDLSENDEIIVIKNDFSCVNAYNEENTTSGIVWTSSDEKIATVDSISGNVKGVRSGIVKITATYQKEECDSVVKSYQLKVVESGNKDVKLQGIISSGNVLIMNVGMTHQLNVGYIPNDGYVEKLEYSSTTPVTAVVSDTGVVTAYTLGKTTITVRANDNNSLMTQVDVYVVSNNMTTPFFGTIAKELKFETESLKVKVGETRKLKYYKDNETTNDIYMKWTSSDESVATVDENGLLTAIKDGSTRITLSTITGVSTVMNVQVEKDIIEVESIGGIGSTIKLKEGEQYTIIPEVKPLDATNKNLTFTSNNPSIASVNPQSGVSTTISGVSVGNTIITVASDNGKTTTVAVEVTSKNNNSSSSSNSGSKENCSAVEKGYSLKSIDNNLFNCKRYAEDWPSDTCASITFTLKDSDYLMVCDYKDGESECNPDNGTKITSSSNVYKLNNLGMRIIKVKQFGGTKPTTLKFWYNIAKTGSNCSNGNSNSSNNSNTTMNKITSITSDCSLISTINVNDIKTIKLTINPSDSSTKNLKINISNPKVISLVYGDSITGEYRFKAKSKGISTITFKTIDGTDISKSYQIIVN